MQQTAGKQKSPSGRRKVSFRLLLVAALATLALAPRALAQDADTEKAIEKYRAMMKEDPWSNPGYLDVDRGEALWRTAAGPKDATLEQCDLGKGPGKVEGAFAVLPKYFADADRVMDLETRLLWCMEKLQGISTAEYVKHPHPAGGQPVKDLAAIATYVASKSAGEKYAAKLDNPQEKEAVTLGETLFYRRSGPFDFACATCHSQSGLRIRLQSLPFLAEKKEAAKVVGEWPAYRVSTAQVMTMQHRLYDCYWQMRMPELELGSDVSVALIAFLTRQAEGGEIAVPGLKR
ncbi:MAG: sulfur oxidation c-type cytochrome SoxA [Alphaproteobacteria bacterium]|nr:sulfur oxidation c-type cytochrome SoxA [Alphaproteobacteria bacterium]